MSRRPNDWKNGPPDAATLRWMVGLGETPRSLAEFYEVGVPKMEAHLEALGITVEQADEYRREVLAGRRMPMGDWT